MKRIVDISSDELLFMSINDVLKRSENVHRHCGGAWIVFDDKLDSNKQFRIQVVTFDTQKAAQEYANTMKSGGDGANIDDAITEKAE